MINISILQIGLSQIQSETTGSVPQGEGGFLAILNQTLGSVKGPSGDAEVSGDGSYYLSILNQRVCLGCGPQALPFIQETATDLLTPLDAIFPGKNPQDKADSDARFSDLLGMLFQVLDRMSKLVSELYGVIPDTLPSSSLDGSGEEVSNADSDARQGGGCPGSHRGLNQGITHGP